MSASQRPNELVLPSKFSSFSEPFDDEPSKSSNWQRYQQVNHKTFGKGVVEKVEQKSTSTYLTIRFRSGIKKLDASFISAV